MIEVKVLGAGCSRCDELLERVESAVGQSGLQVVLSKLSRLDEMLEYKVMMTPALVVGGQVKASGKLPSVEQIITWLHEAAD